MKSVAIDTNVLLTYRLKRKPYFEKAKRLFEQCLDNKAKIILVDEALLEVEWVLRSFYRQTKEEIIEFFQELIHIDNLIMRNKENAEFVLNIYKNSTGISFTDCVIITQIQNFNPDEFLTFDEHLKKFYHANLESN